MHAKSCILICYIRRVARGGGGSIEPPNNCAVTSQKRLRRQLARHCGLVDSHFFLSEVLCGTQCIQTLHRKMLLALAGFKKFAQVREYTAVCSYIPTSKYRGKPLALCKTLVARTCSLEAAHSILSNAVLNFCSTVHRVHYTAGLCHIFFQICSDPRYD